MNNRHRHTKGYKTVNGAINVSLTLFPSTIELFLHKIFNEL